MPLEQHSKSSVADGVAPGCRDVWSRVFGAIDETDGQRVVSRPGVVHADRETKVIARLRRWMRTIDSNSPDGSFIPNAGDAVGSCSVGVDTGAAKEQRD